MVPPPPAELHGFGILRMTGRALVGQASSPSLAWPQINRGMGGKSNAACLRGFEPPEPNLFQNRRLFSLLPRDLIIRHDRICAGPG